MSIIDNLLANTDVILSTLSAKCERGLFMGKLKHNVALGIVFAAMLVSASENGRSVYEDAALWIKGAYDRNANVGMDPQDLRNAVSVSDMLLNRGSWGEATNCIKRYENVICPYSNTELINVPCLNFQQIVDSEGKVHPRHFRVAGKISVTNCISTVVMRVKPEYSSVGSSWVCGGIGYQIGFSKLGDGLLKLRGYCGNWQEANFKLAPGTWLDLAVVKSGESNLKFYAVTNNGTLFSQSMNAMGISSSGVQTNFYLGLSESGYSSWNPVATNSTSQRRMAFRGSLHSIAVWNRQLSEAEIREAFAFPRSDVLRIGVDNGDGGEFIKSSADGTVVNADDWYTMPSKLSPDETVDIEFSLRSFESSLSQLLRLTAASGTGQGARLSVSLNGTAIEEVLQAEAGKVKAILLPGMLFREGRNTLRLTNVSDKDVKFDSLALGGSWQMGVPDDSSAEFQQDAMGNNTTGYMEDGNWKNTDKIVDMRRTNSIVALYPANLKEAGYPAMFSVRVNIPGDPDYYKRQNAEMPNWQLRVNGQKKAEGKFSEKFKTTMYKLKSEELMAGTNVFSIVCNNTTEKNANSWFNIDYWRFEVRRLPLPFVITIR